MSEEMKTFPIYREISRFKGGVQIVVLTVRNIGGQAVMKSVNRHAHWQSSMTGKPFGLLVGRHPDFYDGVDLKNVDAEKMFARLEEELADLTKKLEAVDEEISLWVEDAKLKNFADEIAKWFGLDFGDVFCLFISIQLEVVERLKAKRFELMDAAVSVDMRKEHAEKYLADVQQDFPRMVAYV